MTNEQVKLALFLGNAADKIAAIKFLSLEDQKTLLKSELEQLRFQDKKSLAKGIKVNAAASIQDLIEALFINLSDIDTSTERVLLEACCRTSIEEALVKLNAKEIVLFSSVESHDVVSEILFTYWTLWVLKTKHISPSLQVDVIGFYKTLNRKTEGLATSNLPALTLMQAQNLIKDYFKFFDPALLFLHGVSK